LDRRSNYHRGVDGNGAVEVTVAHQDHAPSAVQVETELLQLTGLRNVFLETIFAFF